MINRMKMFLEAIAASDLQPYFKNALNQIPNSFSQEIKQFRQQNSIRIFTKPGSHQTKAELLRALASPQTHTLFQTCACYSILCKFQFILASLKNGFRIQLFQRCLNQDYLALLSRIAYKQREKVISITLVIIALAVYRKIFKILPKHRQIVDTRFKLDVYHTLHFLIYGTFVSDSNVMLLLQRTTKQTNILPYLISQREQKNRVRMDKRKSYLGQPYQLVEARNEVQSQFQSQIRNLLSHVPKKREERMEGSADFTLPLNPNFEKHFKFDLNRVSDSLMRKLNYKKHCLPSQPNIKIWLKKEYGLKQLIVTRQTQLIQKQKSYSESQKPRSFKKQTSEFHDLNFYRDFISELKNEDYMGVQIRRSKSTKMEWKRKQTVFSYKQHPKLLKQDPPQEVQIIRQEPRFSREQSSKGFSTEIGVVDSSKQRAKRILGRLQNKKQVVLLKQIMQFVSKHDSLN